MIALVAVLVTGIVLMGVGGKTNSKYNNRLMVLRVVLQAAILLLLALLFVSR